MKIKRLQYFDCFHFIAVLAEDLRMLCLQVSYTFSRDFLSLLRKDDNIAEFGRTSVLIRGLQRVCFTASVPSYLVNE